ncbi:MAG: hypothetical protein WD066_02555 [Planctomycetaceae bacterium]
MDEPLDETIRRNAQGPSSVSIDGNSATAQALREQIEADRYLASKQAARSKRLGLRITKIVPPGAH